MLINSGSFLPEYMFTENPEMYLQDDIHILNQNLNDLGKACIKHVYLGHTLDSVQKFIRDVVINKKDYMKEKRIKFLKENLNGTYPNTSLKIFLDIKKNIMEI